MRGFDEEVRTETQTVRGCGNGGGGGVRVQMATDVSYRLLLRHSRRLCAGPIRAVSRVFADGDAFAHVGEMRVHADGEAQNCPAF